MAADRLLDAGRRVFDALNAGGRRGDEYGAARLADGERDAGVGADVRLLQGDGIRAVLLDQLPHPLEDREQPELHALPRLCSPPPVAKLPEAPVAFVDDPVPASCRPWIDAEDFHPERLRTPSDVPAEAQVADSQRMLFAAPALAQLPPGLAWLERTHLRPAIGLTTETVSVVPACCAAVRAAT